MSSRTLLSLAAAAALAVAGCGSSSSSSSAPPGGADQSPPGDIPDNQAFVRYAPPGASFSVKVPEGWARTAKGGAISFTDKLNIVRVEERAGTALPKGSAVRRAGQRAVRVTYQARGAADPVTGKSRVDAVERYVFVHHGREAVLTLSGPKGADNVDPWRIITDSLRWTR